MGEGAYQGVKAMSATLIVVVVSQVYTYVKIYQVVHFKYVQFVICQLYHISQKEKRKRQGL